MTALARTSLVFGCVWLLARALERGIEAGIVAATGRLR